MGAIEIRDSRAPHGKSYLGYDLVYRTFTSYTLHSFLSTTRTRPEL